MNNKIITISNSQFWSINCKFFWFYKYSYSKALIFYNSRLKQMINLAVEKYMIQLKNKQEIKNDYY